MFDLVFYPIRNFGVFFVAYMKIIDYLYNMEKLIPMTEYVLGIDSIVKRGEEELYDDFMIRCFLSIDHYANFLKQPLNLGMFVPCDEDENVLEQTCIIINTSKCRDCACREYEKAKEKVLFKGFELCLRNEKKDCVVIGNFHLSLMNISNKTIEDLVEYNLELTDNAIKQL